GRLPASIAAVVWDAFLDGVMLSPSATPSPLASEVPVATGGHPPLSDGHHSTQPGDGPLRRSVENRSPLESAHIALAERERLHAEPRMRSLGEGRRRGSERGRRDTSCHDGW